jgi:hypothetical protein
MFGHICQKSGWQGCMDSYLCLLICSIGLLVHFWASTKNNKITADYSLKAIRAQSEVFRALKENNLNSRILYPEMLSFKIKEGIKPSMINRNNDKLKQYMSSKPALQNILKGILYQMF